MASSESKEKTSLEKYANVDWLSELKKLSNACNKKGFKVKIIKCKDHSSEIDFNKREILIHNRHTPELQFYALIHEVGHLLVNKKWMHAYSKDFCNFSKQSLTYKVAGLEEELEAWTAGYKEAKRLKLKVNKRKFLKTKASWVSSYIMWSVDRKIQKEIEKQSKKCSDCNKIIDYDKRI